MMHRDRKNTSYVRAGGVPRMPAITVVVALLGFFIHIQETHRKMSGGLDIRGILALDSTQESGLGVVVGEVDVGRVGV